MMSEVFIIDGEEVETPWEFDTVCETEQVDIGEPFKGNGYCKVKGMLDGLILHARYRWPICFRVDGNALKDCEYLEFKINSRGTVEVRKEKKG